jgi:hypothetical protein
VNEAELELGEPVIECHPFIIQMPPFRVNAVIVKCEQLSQIPARISALSAGAKRAWAAYLSEAPGGGGPWCGPGIERTKRAPRASIRTLRGRPSGTIDSQHSMC